MNRETFLREFNYSYDDVVDYIESLKDLKILVIGETIIDEYQHGFTLGKAGKSPIVAFQNSKSEQYAGGVLAIRNHLKDFMNVDYWTEGDAIIKTRFIHETQKIFETYTNIDNKYKNYHNNFSNYDLILVSDFGHGMLKREIRDKIVKESNYLSLNCQRNAGNMGFNTINKYQGANYICLDEYELRLATSNQYEKLEEVIKNKFFDETVSITRNIEGCYIYKDNNLIDVPAFADNIIDTIGAGDAYLSITSPLAYIKAPLEIIGFVGNVAGAIACSYVANKECITKNKLYDFISKLLNATK